MISLLKGRLTITEAHMIRWLKTAAQLSGKHNILHGDEMQFASYFSWCGHVALLTKADPQRETSRILMMKNMELMAAEFQESLDPNIMDVGSGCGDGSRPLRSVLAQTGRTWHRIGWRGGPRWMR